ncbi:rod shape-determining protein MreD [Formosimonas limnophila]|uniref:Rod shape-determining protein MreD n=1 Tax=Formosimonas limnophila TaxID=1384487 RepID=A0A8J3CNT8_9BURK|nr:rod shape-determining protein MreD [Formosimonas limnophila]GHA77136.1 rod shape-determining protein MreD [Formosimonas limnophila]
MRVEQWLGTVRARVVWLTLIVAWLLSFVVTVRATVWLDWVALVLLFWTVYQPARISLILAFVVGILIDVQQASILGEHALLYVWGVALMQALASRLQFSSVFVHALYGTGLLLLMQVMRALGHAVFLGEFDNLAGLVWVLLGVVAWMLLATVLHKSARSNAVGAWVSK